MASALDSLNGDTDLLGQLDSEGESAGKAWRPGMRNDDGTYDPDGIEGVVVKRFTMPSDAQYGPVKDIPCVQIRNAESGDWQIRGYRSILADEIVEKDPQPGDTFAVKYGGQPQGKKYHVYKAAVLKGTPGKVPAAPETSGSDKPPF